MSVFPEVANDFVWLGIDQRGIAIRPDCHDLGGNVSCEDAPPAECPFREASGEPVLPFPLAQCDEIFARLANLTYEEQVGRLRSMLADFVGCDASAAPDEEMGIIFSILRAGALLPGTYHSYGNETVVRWYYRLLQLEQNLCASAPRFTRTSPSGRAYNTFAFIGTRELARDIDLFRAAVGASKLSLVGYSYGTVVAPAYATFFPHRVGRMVLDGGVPPAATVQQQSTHEARSYHSVLNGILNDCSLSVYQGFAEEHRCPLAPGPSSKLLDMVTDDARPARASAAFAEALTMIESIDRAPLSMDCLARLYSGSDLPADCHGGANVQVPSEPLGPAPGGDRFVTLIVAIQALDNAGRLSEEALISWWRDTLSASPLGTWRALFFAAPQGSWPVYPKPLPPAGDAKLPVLIVGNLHDQATDYSGAQQLRAAYPAGALVTWQGYGHTLPQVSSVPATSVTQYANDEALRHCRELVTRYLASGELPRDGHVCPLAAPLNLGPSAAPVQRRADGH